MAEIVYKSPGVFTREIDNSQPSQTTQALSTPAGIVGTANLGPAFVPITVNSINEFTSIFGDIDGSSFGKIAAAEYLKNGGGSVSYVRVLGAGNGKARNSNGSVTNAGYFVGNENIQANGNFGKSVFANNGEGEVLGRTYFLGCFMSESNGSTIFSEAGIQSSTTEKASLAAALDTTGKGLTPLGNNNTLVITVPKSIGGQGVTTIKFVNTDADGTDGAAAGTIGIGIGSSPTDADYHAAIIAAINGDFTNSRVTAASSLNGTEGVVGIVASDGGSNTINLTAVNVGPGGNSITLAMSANTILKGGATSVSLADGIGGAVPILRGVLLAPSGVALSLSGAYYNDVSQTPLLTTTATTNGTKPRYGQMTGSIEVAASGTFVMILNGFKGSSERPSNVITASFESNNDFYFGKEGVFNTDPLKIEEHGHLLYSHYYIHPAYATITGSGAVPPGVINTHENTAFILTGSVARGATSGFGNVPDYEDWQDRYSHAESPYIISQDGQDLFKLVSLSPGEDFSSKYKFSISGINPTEKTFNLTIRHASDSDKLGISLAEPIYKSLSLDPNSLNYISRVIGDIHTKFDFDNDEASQKIIVEGSHYGVSNLVRVVVSNDLENGNIDSNAIPWGFRGPMHTVTSGSMMDYIAGNFGEADILQRIIEPPIPYRENVTNDTGTSKASSTDYYWGYQNEPKITVAEPNALPVIAKPNAHAAYIKHYPTHRTDTTAFAVKENKGAANVNGSVLDVDLFNKSLFSLNNVKVKTGSHGNAAPAEWEHAVYVRAGEIVADESAKTRALAVSDVSFSNNSEYIKFTCLFQGGFNGVNKFNKDKAEFTNDAVKREYDNITDQGGVKNGPTIKSYRKALDILGSKADVDIQLLTNPGIRHSSITDYGISVAENRFDALYLMDIEQYDSLNNVITGSTTELNKPSITYTIQGFNNRNLNTSFGASYFPDVNLTVNKTDGTTTSKLVPPTVAVLGAFAVNDTIGKSWFAPAGNTRGKLDNATSTELGLLSRTNMDSLYSADINPINNYTNGDGVVIQGQKTLLKNLSALDRINVRRLLITVRRAVRNIANTLIFEPNRPETLSNFRASINPILESLKSQQGVARYKVVIDETTTTQADVENNTIRGKIYLQPVRIAEFIALDFNITNNGIID